MKKQLLKIHENRLELGGQDFYLASGDFHYFRTMPDGWRYRIRLMKAFGLTALQTYVPWNLHEPREGEFDFSGMLDLRAFLKLCAEEEIYVLLRPSPYICSECDFGGLPSWLLTKDFTVRTSDSGFIEAYERYFDRLKREIVPELSTNGGAVIMVALENEYGSFGMDADYLREIIGIYHDSGIDVPLYTAGGPDMYKQVFGGFPEIWSGVDLRCKVTDSIESVRRFQTGFPPLVSEFWAGCAQQWGGVFPRQTPETVAKNYREALEAGAYVNFYMFCGGTNFGFFNGALDATFRADVKGAKKRYIPFATSYDVDAPVSEDGTPTEKYFACRKVLAEYRGVDESELPPLPEKPAVQIPEKPVFTSRSPLFDSLDFVAEKRVRSGGTRTMESLGQDYGFILYSSVIRKTDPDATYRLHIDGLHDRADIYIDKKFAGTYFRDRDSNPVEFGIRSDVRLDILVENMGRINYGYRMLDDQKGICGAVRLDVIYPNGSMMYNQGIVTNFEISTLPMKPDRIRAELENGGSSGGACFFGGSFRAEEGKDAFLRFRVKGAGRGFVLINGFNIGRYHAIGPQDTLFVPGALLQEENRIEIFELYPEENPPEFEFVGKAELDSIKQNAELVLAARA